MDGTLTSVLRMGRKRVAVATFEMNSVIPATMTDIEIAISALWRLSNTVSLSPIHSLKPDSYNKGNASLLKNCSDLKVKKQQPDVYAILKIIMAQKYTTLIFGHSGVSKEIQYCMITLVASAMANPDPNSIITSQGSLC